MSVEEANKARDEGIQRAADGAGRPWQERALETLRRVAEAQEHLTTDDLRLAGVDECPGDPRAFGAVMVEAAHRGWIRPTDRTVCSDRKTSHRRPMRIWASYLYQNGVRLNALLDRLDSAVSKLGG